MPATVLIVDDEKNTREGLSMALEDKYEVYLAADADEAFNLMAEIDFEVILTDLRMAGKSGMKVIDKAIEMPHSPICIMMTAYGTVDTAVDAMKRGAFDFLTKPVNLTKLELLILRALKSRTLEKENVVLHKRLDKKYDFNKIIGNSKGLHDILDKVKLVAPARTTVLIEGETGTGKELIAQALHQNSPRARNNFVAVHCASLPSNLLESEIFGHEKGSFTGAVEKRIGRFESADKGTLFLDEIGEIDASTQVKLLRFLETKTFERVGGTKPITVDVRLVCATNRNLEELVEKGVFREDLIYRLKVVALGLPPLRERKDDVMLLINHYVKYFADENGHRPLTFTSNAQKVLLEYAWPGNIRELRNFCENVVVMHHDAEIDVYDLEQKFLNNTKAVSRFAASDKALSVEENEKILMRNALRKVRGNKTKAAELLGISRRTLHRKLKQWPEIDVK